MTALGSWGLVALIVIAVVLWLVDHARRHPLITRAEDLPEPYRSAPLDDLADLALWEQQVADRDALDVVEDWRSEGAA